MNNLVLIVKDGNTSYDVSDLIIKVTWSGRKGAAPRTVEAVLHDSEQLEKRAPINCGKGQKLFLYEKDSTGAKKELFRGQIMSDSRSEKRQLKIKAYDACIKLVNNKASHSYKKKRADQIFRSCCKRLGLKVGTVAKTGHKIGEIVKKGTTFWDVIEDALSQTYKTKKKRYYVYADKGKLYLVHRKMKSTMPVIELGSNVSSYERTRSIEDTRTRLKLITSKGKSKGTTKAKSLEKKIGVWREVEQVDEKLTKTQKKQRINAFKMEKAKVGQSMKITALGVTSVKAGGCVYVHIPTEGIKKAMFVEEDTHTWEKGQHTMTLKLDFYV